uniref:Uncharacterized protein n=1 Tax=Candidatus Kentrum sp. UNK TaxID=2126344 RepID=A0A451ASV5_9GAMM|nr:MAG: hypothetical protein BECKUNK1418G_GA0071005_101735 [Candidatus Kentron sp. UNK]VFK69113.1 MAG: hypothetical protein BECKUNK1418H_GA0071006_101034 [Candidatus Kentron sp. UNK]
MPSGSEVRKKKDKEFLRIGLSKTVAILLSLPFASASTHIGKLQVPGTIIDQLSGNLRQNDQKNSIAAFRAQREIFGAKGLISSRRSLPYGRDDIFFIYSLSRKILNKTVKKSENLTLMKRVPITPANEKRARVGWIATRIHREEKMVDALRLSTLRPL